MYRLTNAGIKPAGTVVSAPPEVHVWVHIAGEDPEEGGNKVLDADERARAGRIRSDIQRRWFVAAHAALRSVLGSCLRVGPEQIRFRVADGGKPDLSDECRAELAHASRLHFSMSHSEGVTLIAVGHGFEVGVDVESERPLPDWSAVAGFAFSPAERRVLGSCDGDAERTRYFYRIWVRKEAYLKGLGVGLAARLEGVCVLPIGEARAEVADARDTGTARPPKVAWFVTDLAVPRGYVGALATPVKNPLVRVRRFPGGLVPTVTV
jgi:4'-phosphopantetheinyl transferase